MKKLFLTSSLIFVMNVAKAMDKKEPDEFRESRKEIREIGRSILTDCRDDQDFVRDPEERRTLTDNDRRDIRECSGARSACFEVVNAMAILHKDMNKMMNHLSGKIDTMQKSLTAIDARVSTIEKALAAKKE